MPSKIGESALTLTTELFRVMRMVSQRIKCMEVSIEVYALKVDRQHLFSLQSAIGVRLDYLIHTRKFCLQLQLSLAWQYEYLNLDHTVDLTTMQQQPKRRILGVIAPGRHTFLLGLSIFWQLLLNILKQRRATTFNGIAATSATQFT
ncbi:MAG: autotransporter outer membrane beta-barrel domain-containing protein [Chlamydiota bacterium]